MRVLFSAAHKCSIQLFLLLAATAGAGLQVIQAMKPNALPPLADRYCTAINSLLRRELHAYTTELKRSAMARMASAPQEPDIVKGFKKVRRKFPTVFHILSLLLQ